MLNGSRGLVHQNRRPTRTEIRVIGIVGRLVGRSKILRHNKAAGELEERVAIVIGRTRRVGRVEDPVASDEKQIITRICRGRAPAHPNATVSHVWSYVEHRRL